MIKVAGVRFKSTGKMYYFDPGDLPVKRGGGVIVETARGMEYGTVQMETTEMRESDIVKPLKRIVRIADEKDIKRHNENERKKNRAMSVCREKIEKHHLDMRLIDVEYTFDNNKIIFYFTSEGRVDFRDLVKDLAGIFKMRIELRQVGVRDEAKMLGGIGCCGRSLCCASWLTDFQPVSIKMAKVQNLSLNPTKISGVCGRLMCCLKYENDTYLELRKGLPDVNENVKTEDGIGKVMDADVLTGRIKIRYYTGETDDNGQEKLGSEIVTFQKEDVVRLGKGNRNGNGSERKKAPESAKDGAAPKEGKSSHNGKEERSGKRKSENSRSGKSRSGSQEGRKPAASEKNHSSEQAPKGEGRKNGGRNRSHGRRRNNKKTQNQD